MKNALADAIIWEAKNNLANTLVGRINNGQKVLVYELVETESSKYRDWGNPAEYEHGNSSLDYAVMYNCIDAAAVILKYGNPSKDDLNRALTKARRYNVHPNLIKLIEFYGGKSEEKLDTEASPLTSENRKKYGLKGELIAELRKAEKNLILNYAGWLKVDRAEAKVRQTLTEAENFCYEFLGITPDQFITDYEGVLKSGITRQSVEYLIKELDTWTNEHVLKDIFATRRILRGIVEAHGGTKEFPNEDPERVWVYWDPTYPNKLAKAVEEKFGNIFDIFEPLRKAEREFSSEHRAYNGAKKAKEELLTRYAKEYLDSTETKDSFDIPNCWRPYGFHLY